MTTTVSLQLSNFPPPSPLPPSFPATHSAFFRRAPSGHAGWAKGLVANGSGRRWRNAGPLLVGREDIELRVPEAEEGDDDEDYEDDDDDDEEEDVPPSPQDLEYIQEIKRVGVKLCQVLELLKKNRDMIFNEVKLTIMIEDPREVERRKMFGIDDPDAPTREELAEALEMVNEGKVPRNRLALRMLADEMTNWPNLEVEVSKKSKPTKSLYARVTDTGIDLKEAAKRLKTDWDSAAEIEDSENSDDSEVPSAVGYGALYLVTAFPVIIGVSVVLILFYNSLQ
ncbi:unnamed protein product [Linum tenue]|uniref:Ycf3-interacting protein 1, chloroplastic n=1 Tax=Linum tenue TaxID=586396 RepID=A0AAV0QM69_9ROSI|nr:unnamed protein product [Linum tenue]